MAIFILMLVITLGSGLALLQIATQPSESV